MPKSRQRFWFDFPTSHTVNYLYEPEIDKKILETAHNVI